MIIRRTQLALSVSAAIALVATCVQAQDSNTDTEKRSLEEVVVTAQKVEQTAQTVSRSIDVIDAGTISNIGATDLQQVLDTIPGYGLAGFQSQPSLRGIGNDLVDSGSPGGAPTVVVNVDGAGAGSGSGSGGSRPQGQNGMQAALFDVERVEVVMGPSGTMQGQNALAGSINVVTRNPVLDEWDFNASLQYGNYNQQVYSLGVNVPIAETLALRAAYQEQSHDAYNSTKCVTDIVLGPPGTPAMCTAGQVSDSTGTQDTTQARVKLLWEPSDTFRTILAVQYDKDDSDAIITGNPDWDDPWQFTIAQPGPPGSPPPPEVVSGEAVVAGPLIIFPSAEGPKNYRYTGEIEWDMGWATLTELAALSTSKISTCPAGETCSDDERFSNEIRLQNTTESGIEWIVGYYYDKFTTNSRGCGTPGGDCSAEDVQVVNPPNININQAALLSNAVDRGLLNPTIMASTNTAGSRDSQSIYASIVYPLSDTQRIRAGIRRAEDNSGSDPLGYITGTMLPDNDIEMALFDVTADNGTLLAEDLSYDEAVAYLAAETGRKSGASCTNCVVAFAEGPYNFSGSSQPFNWNVVWEWDFNDNGMMYVGLNTGYKAGGVQQSKIPSQTFEPQEVLQYSLGFKTRMFDNTVQWNTELYYYNFTNYQLQVNNYQEVPVEVGGTTYTLPDRGQATAGNYDIMWPDPLLNGETRNPIGIQTELVTVPNQTFVGLESTVTALVTDSDKVTANLTLANRRFGNVTDATGRNLAGQQVANSPQIAGYVTYEHYFENILGGTITPRITARYTGFTPVSNEVTDGAGVYLDKQFQDAYWKYDANISWASYDGHWAVNLYGNNLANTAENRGAPPFDGSFTPVPFLHGTISPPRTYGIKVDYNY